MLGPVTLQKLANKLARWQRFCCSLPNRHGGLIQSVGLNGHCHLNAKQFLDSRKGELLWRILRVISPREPLELGFRCY